MPQSQPLFTVGGRRLALLTATSSLAAALEADAPIYLTPDVWDGRRRARASSLRLIGSAKSTALSSAAPSSNGSAEDVLEGLLDLTPDTWPLQRAPLLLDWSDPAAPGFADALGLEVAAVRTSSANPHFDTVTDAAFRPYLGDHSACLGQTAADRPPLHAEIAGAQLPASSAAKAHNRSVLLPQLLRAVMSRVAPSGTADTSVDVGVCRVTVHSAALTTHGTSAAPPELAACHCRVLVHLHAQAQNGASSAEGAPAELAARDFLATDATAVAVPSLRTGETGACIAWQWHEPLLVAAPVRVGLRGPSTSHPSTAYMLRVVVVADTPRPAADGARGSDGAGGGAGEEEAEEELVVDTIELCSTHVSLQGCTPGVPATLLLSMAVPAADGAQASEETPLPTLELCATVEPLRLPGFEPAQAAWTSAKRAELEDAAQHAAAASATTAAWGAGAAPVSFRDVAGAQSLLQACLSPLHDALANEVEAAAIGAEVGTPAAAGPASSATGEIGAAADRSHPAGERIVGILALHVPSMTLNALGGLDAAAAALSPPSLDGLSRACEQQASAWAASAQAAAYEAGNGSLDAAAATGYLSSLSAYGVSADADDDDGDSNDGDSDAGPAAATSAGETPAEPKLPSLAVLTAETWDSAAAAMPQWNTGADASTASRGFALVAELVYRRDLSSAPAPRGMAAFGAAAMPAPAPPADGGEFGHAEMADARAVQVLQETASFRASAALSSAGPDGSWAAFGATEDAQGDVVLCRSAPRCVWGSIHAPAGAASPHRADSGLTAAPRSDISQTVLLAGASLSLPLTSTAVNLATHAALSEYVGRLAGIERKAQQAAAAGGAATSIGGRSSGAHHSAAVPKSAEYFAASRLAGRAGEGIEGANAAHGPTSPLQVRICVFELTNHSGSAMELGGDAAAAVSFGQAVACAYTPLASLLVGGAASGVPASKHRLNKGAAARSAAASDSGSLTAESAIATLPLLVPRAQALPQSLRFSTARPRPKPSRGLQPLHEEGAGGGGRRGSNPFLEGTDDAAVAGRGDDGQAESGGEDEGEEEEVDMDLPLHLSVLRLPHEARLTQLAAAFEAVNERRPSMATAVVISQWLPVAADGDTSLLLPLAVGLDPSAAASDRAVSTALATFHESAAAGLTASAQSRFGPGASAGAVRAGVGSASGALRGPGAAAPAPATRWAVLSHLLQLGFCSSLESGIGLAVSLATTCLVPSLFPATCRQLKEHAASRPEASGGKGAAGHGAAAGSAPAGSATSPSPGRAFESEEVAALAALLQAEQAAGIVTAHTLQAYADGLTRVCRQPWLDMAAEWDRLCAEARGKREAARAAARAAARQARLQAEAELEAKRRERQQAAEAAAAALRDASAPPDESFSRFALALPVRPETADRAGIGSGDTAAGGVAAPRDGLAGGLLGVGVLIGDGADIPRRSEPLASEGASAIHSGASHLVKAPAKPPPARRRSSVGNSTIVPLSAALTSSAAAHPGSNNAGSGEETFWEELPVPAHAQAQVAAITTLKARLAVLQRELLSHRAGIATLEQEIRVLRSQLQQAHEAQAQAQRDASAAERRRREEDDAVFLLVMSDVSGLSSLVAAAEAQRKDAAAAASLKGLSAALAADITRGGGAGGAGRAIASLADKLPPRELMSTYEQGQLTQDLKSVVDAARRLQSNVHSLRGREAGAPDAAARIRFAPPPLPPSARVAAGGTAADSPAAPGLADRFAAAISPRSQAADEEGLSVAGVAGLVAGLSRRLLIVARRYMQAKALAASLMQKAKAAGLDLHADAPHSPLAPASDGAGARGGQATAQALNLEAATTQLLLKLAAADKRRGAAGGEGEEVDDEAEGGPDGLPAGKLPTPGPYAAAVLAGVVPRSEVVPALLHARLLDAFASVYGRCAAAEAKVEAASERLAEVAAAHAYAVAEIGATRSRAQASEAKLKGQLAARGAAIVGLEQQLTALLDGGRSDSRAHAGSARRGESVPRSESSYSSGSSAGRRQRGNRPNRGEKTSSRSARPGDKSPAHRHRSPRDSGRDSRRHRDHSYEARDAGATGEPADDDPRNPRLSASIRRLDGAKPQSHRRFDRLDEFAADSRLLPGSRDTPPYAHRSGTVSALGIATGALQTRFHDSDTAAPAPAGSRRTLASVAQRALSASASVGAMQSAAAVLHGPAVAGRSFSAAGAVPSMSPLRAGVPGSEPGIGASLRRLDLASSSGASHPVGQATRVRWRSPTDEHDDL